MKFGHNLARNQVPEWASNYINYKGLKKLIKAAEKGAESGGETDLAGIYTIWSEQSTHSIDHPLQSSRTLSIVTSKMSTPFTTESTRSFREDSDSSTTAMVKPQRSPKA